MTAGVRLRRVDKVYPDGTHAVVGLDLELEPGELMVIVGPSGCGKSTTLRMTAGLEDISSGEIFIGERVVNSLEPGDRDVAMVFQNYALYPHMTVFDNLAFPLRARGVPKADIRRRVEQTARLLELDGQLARKPRTLSGGQRQRVAMGRAIVREPQVFLMDEPLSNLDARLRTEMRAEITALQRELGVTTMYVTHDQLEAMTMATRIAVLRDGLLQQCGVPQAVYDRPHNLFVARFIGSPPMNLLPGRVARERDTLQCVLGEQRLPLGSDGPAAGLARYVDRDVIVGVRPEHLTEAESGENALRGRITLVELLGAEQLVKAELPVAPVDARDGRKMPTSNAVVTARLSARTRVSPGELIDLRVAVEGVHFFDAETGHAIR